MVTGISIVLLFTISCLLVFLEKYMDKYKLPVYIFLGIALILIAGLREVGIDPDSGNYEYTYHNYSSIQLLDGIEYSFLLISSILNHFSNDVHILFIFYAFWGVSLKFLAFRQLSNLWFLPVVVYLSFYYELHEMTQIRTGILSGIFLLSIKSLADGKKIQFCLMIILGAFFHISALLLLPLAFLDNQEISLKKRIFWCSLIPAGYIAYMMGATALLQFDIPYIGLKLANYQAAEDKGVGIVSINVFSPKTLFTTFIFFYLMYFHDTIKEYNKFFPILLKIYAIGLFSFTSLGFLPVLAERVSFLFETVTIITFTCAYYTLRPKWAGMLLVIMIAFVYLNYALPYVSFHLFWKG